MERIHKVPARIREKGGVFSRIPDQTLRGPVDDQLSPRINSIRSTPAGHDDRVTLVHAHTGEEVSVTSFTGQHIASQPYRDAAEIGDANVRRVLVVFSWINRVDVSDLEVSYATPGRPDTDPALVRLGLESKEQGVMRPIRPYKEGVSQALLN